MFKEVELSAELLHPIPYQHALDIVEHAGRTCYQSFSTASPDKQESFIKGLIQKGHESVLEHVNITMLVKIDRGILAEWTRHRIGSAYSVSSTRYIDYSRQPIEYIMPTLPEGVEEHKGLLETLIQGELNSYRHLIQDHNFPPQIARAVLPQSFAVNMVVTHNIRQWRHVLKERLVNPKAHPDIRKVMKLCHMHLVGNYPVFFEDITIPE